MKRLAIIVALSVALGGCAQWENFKTAVEVVTTSIANPVTKKDLYVVESGVLIAFKALNAYRTACVQGLVDTHCKANIAILQTYTKQLPPYLSQLRGFVKNNDQVDAKVVYEQIKTLLANIRSTSAALGVNMGV